MKRMGVGHIGVGCMGVELMGIGCIGVRRVGVGYTCIRCGFGCEYGYGC